MKPDTTEHRPLSERLRLRAREIGLAVALTLAAVAILVAAVLAQPDAGGGPVAQKPAATTR